MVPGIGKALTGKRKTKNSGCRNGDGLFRGAAGPGRTPGGGVDLTPAMLEEARALAAQRGLDITFREMDAQTLDYEDGCFDAVISRNLTWTLPDPERAYGQWFRVLKPGGVLLNFDADYAANVRSRSTQNRRVPADSPYGHVGMTDRLQRENDEITLTMDVGRARPAWDREVLEGIGFADCRVDTRVGRRILGPLDLEHAPMFGIAARKP
ncbi:MAG: class I SAM-dependent methyltransferase [Oscillospiraceae bacterium]